MGCSCTLAVHQNDEMKGHLIAQISTDIQRSWWSEANDTAPPPGQWTPTMPNMRIHPHTPIVPKSGNPWPTDVVGYSAVISCSWRRLARHPSIPHGSSSSSLTITSPCTHPPKLLDTRNDMRTHNLSTQRERKTHITQHNAKRGKQHPQEIPYNYTQGTQYDLCDIHFVR